RRVERQRGPADRGGREAEAEAVPGDAVGLDADELRGLAVLDRGAQRLPEPAVLHEQVEQRERERREAERDELDDGDPRPEELDARARVRELDAPLRAAPDEADHALNEERDGERQED